nr:hypothetical protein [uncultured Peptostreptococcus sp.]
MKAIRYKKESDLNNRYSLNRKNSIKLYNLFFPLWVLILFPMFWIVSMPFNFVVDSIVLLIGLRLVSKGQLWKNYSRSILQVWICGYIADMIGSGLMFLSTMFGFKLTGNIGIAIRSIADNVMENPFKTPDTFIYVTVFIVLVAILIYFLNYKFCLRKTDLDKAQKKKLSMLIAVLTAPYLFYLPTTTFYNFIENIAGFFLR